MSCELEAKTSCQFIGFNHGILSHMLQSYGSLIRWQVNEVSLLSCIGWFNSSRKCILFRQGHNSIASMRCHSLIAPKDT